jgi:hypothetical protein
VIRPVAVREPVTTNAGAVIPEGIVALMDGLAEGPVIRMPLFTVVATLWSTPLLLIRMPLDDAPVTVVVPTASDPTEGEHEEPKVQVAPPTVTEGFAKSAFVTSPAAVNEPVTVNAVADRPLGSVVPIDGTPPLLVVRMPLLALGSAAHDPPGLA